MVALACRSRWCNIPSIKVSTYGEGGVRAFSSLTWGMCRVWTLISPTHCCVGLCEMNGGTSKLASIHSIVDVGQQRIQFIMDNSISQLLPFPARLIDCYVFHI